MKIILSAFLGVFILYVGADVYKPSGIFSSSPGGDIFSHPRMRGVLIRAAWKDLEPEPGSFNFDRLDAQLAGIKPYKKNWSLAVMAGGIGSPLWLTEKEKIPSVAFKFRGEKDASIPAFWHEKTQSLLALLADELGRKYSTESGLVLVYIPQMTANGVEGHLNGVDMNAMKEIGYTDEKWINAAIRVSHSFAAAFPEKALAYEVHEIDRSARVPEIIINRLWEDPILKKRVGAAVWWLSGNETYQADLLKVLRDFPGDIYCQMIGRSDQSHRFPSGYQGAFTQAKSMKARYIEVWEWDFQSGNRGANGAWDNELKDFNEFTDALKK